MISSCKSGEIVDQGDSQVQEPDLWDPVVLALPAAPVNFMPHQIHLQANDDDVLMDEVEVINPNFF
jgi:hypothetical protein